MTAREKKAYENIKWAAVDLIGSLENAVGDCNDEEAEAMLNNHEALVNEVYDMATTMVYGDGYCAVDELAVRDINFCGKEVLMAFCDQCITNEGY